MTYPLWAHWSVTVSSEGFLHFPLKPLTFSQAGHPWRCQGEPVQQFLCPPSQQWVSPGWVLVGWFFFIPSTARAFREWVHECCLAVSLQWCSRASLSPPICWSHHKAIWPLPLHQWQATIRLGFPKQDDLQSEFCHDLFVAGRRAKRKTEGPVFNCLLPLSNFSGTSLGRQKKPQDLDFSSTSSAQPEQFICVTWQQGS